MAKVKKIEIAEEVPAATRGDFDHRGKLTVNAMRAAISRGGSVLHNGKIITNIDDLPSEAEVAEGDEGAELTAMENIERQQKALDAQKSRLAAAAKSRGKVEKVQA